jgi:hypothetical protein
MGSSEEDYSSSDEEAKLSLFPKDYKFELFPGYDNVDDTSEVDEFLREFNFANDFANELITRFKLVRDEAVKIERELASIENENFLFNKIDHLNNLDKDHPQFLPLFIPGAKSRKLASPLAYTCMLYGLFSLARRKFLLRLNEPGNDHYATKMMMTIQDVPFTRLFLDFDISESDFDREDEICQKVFDILKACNLPFEFTKTIRYKRTNKSFHLISKAQYDRFTANFLVEQINDMITSTYGKLVCPDFVQSIGLPTARNHLLPPIYLFNFELFKTTAIIDVWDRKIYSLLNEVEKGGSSDFEISVNGVTKISFRPRMGRFSLFFIKFEQFVDSKHEFLSTGMFKSYNQLLKCIVPLVGVVEELEILENSNVINETYQNIFIAEVEYKKSLYDIFEPYVKPVDDHLKVEEITFDEIFKTENDDEHEDFILGNVDGIWTPRMIEMKKRVEDAQVPSNIWETIVPKLFSKNLLYTLPHSDVGRYLWIICLFYQNYCIGKGIICESREYINSVIEKKLCSETDRELVNVVKHIIKLMLNDNIVSSTLAWLLRANPFSEKISPIDMSITILDKFGIECEVARYNLYHYCNEDIMLGGDTISIALTKSFQVNDVLYFLFQNYSETAQRKVEIFNSMIGGDEEEKDPPKKKQKNGEFFSDYAKFIHPFLLYATINGSTVYYFNVDRYVSVSAVDSRGSGMVFREVETEPLKGVIWYRREIINTSGLYNSISQTFERNTPSLYSGIFVLTHQTYKNYSPNIYNALNFDTKSFMFTTYMKVGQFLKILSNNRNAILLLGKPNGGVDLDYITDLTNVLDIDMNHQMNFSPKFFSLLFEQDEFKNLKILFKYLALIICDLSQRYKIDLRNRANFLLLFQGHSKSNINTEYGKEDIGITFNYLNESKKSTLFFERLYRVTEKSRAIGVVSDNREIKLSSNRFSSNGVDELNEFVILTTLNGVINCDYDYNQNDYQVNEFIMVILSWFLRIKVVGDFENSSFFQKLEEYREVAFNEFGQLYKNFFGQLAINCEGIPSIARYFKKFCENTTVIIPNDYKYKYKLNEGKSKYEEEIYLGFVDLMAQAQYDLDTFVDLYKILCSYTHRGSVLRRFLALLKKTATGKNSFIEKVIDRLFPGALDLQCFENKDLQNGYTNVGYAFCTNLWSNLLVWFDEVKTLPNEMKSYVNQSTLTKREFHASKKGAFNINTSLIVSSNDTPVGNDIATNLRMLPINRILQYVELYKGLKIERENSVLDATLQPINEVFGIQLLLEKLPSKGEWGVCSVGMFMLVWNNASLFYKSYDQPISKIFSMTMNQNIKEILYSSSPHIFILEKDYFKFTPSSRVSEDDFKKKVDDIISKNMDIFKRVDKKNIYSLLRDHISSYIDEEGKRVYVEFLK